VVYKSNNNVVYSLQVSRGLVPEIRVFRCSSSSVDARMNTLIRETPTARRYEVIELEVMPDHVHLLVEVDPQGVHRLVQQIKGRSSHALRKEFHSLTTRLPTLWTNSYFVSTVGGSPLAGVKQYFENQKRSQP
jgi:putative transposase